MPKSGKPMMRLRIYKRLTNLEDLNYGNRVSIGINFQKEIQH